MQSKRWGVQDHPRHCALPAASEEQRAGFQWYLCTGPRTMSYHHVHQLPSGQLWRLSYIASDLCDSCAIHFSSQVSSSLTCITGIADFTDFCWSDGRR